MQPETKSKLSKLLFRALLLAILYFGGKLIYNLGYLAGVQDMATICSTVLEQVESQCQESSQAQPEQTLPNWSEQPPVEI